MAGHAFVFLFTAQVNSLTCGKLSSAVLQMDKLVFYWSKVWWACPCVALNSKFLQVNRSTSCMETTLLLMQQVQAFSELKNKTKMLLTRFERQKRLASIKNLS